MRSKNSFLTITVVACLSLGLTGCMTLRVGSDYDRFVDFSNYQTFDWLDDTVKAVIEPGERDVALESFARNSLLDKRVRRYVEANLRERGLIRIEDGTPDLLLRYYVAFRDRTLVTSSPDPFFRRHGSLHRRHRHGSFHSGTRISLRDFQEGTLILDAIDPRRNQLVWRGWSVGRTKDFMYDEKQVRAAVERILEKLPVS